MVRLSRPPFAVTPRYASCARKTMGYVAAATASTQQVSLIQSTATGTQSGRPMPDGQLPTYTSACQIIQDWEMMIYDDITWFLKKESFWHANWFMRQKGPNIMIDQLMYMQ